EHSTQRRRIRRQNSRPRKQRRLLFRPLQRRPRRNLAQRTRRGHGQRMRSSTTPQRRTGYGRERYDGLQRASLRAVSATVLFQRRRRNLVRKDHRYHAQEPHLYGFPRRHRGRNTAYFLPRFFPHSRKPHYSGEQG